MTKDIILYCGDNDEEKVLPTKWEICGRCEGEGTSSAYLGAFTRDQMEDDPEFFEQYLQGAYDRPCDGCGGSGKVKVLDEERCDPVDLAAYQEQLRGEREDAATQRMEMLMEGGWRDMGWYG